MSYHYYFNPWRISKQDGEAMSGLPITVIMLFLWFLLWGVTVLAWPFTFVLFGIGYDGLWGVMWPLLWVMGILGFLLDVFRIISREKEKHNRSKGLYSCGQPKPHIPLPNEYHNFDSDPREGVGKIEVL